MKKKKINVIVLNIKGQGDIKWIRNMNVKYRKDWKIFKMHMTGGGLSFLIYIDLFTNQQQKDNTPKNEQRTWVGSS